MSQSVDYDILYEIFKSQIKTGVYCPYCGNETYHLDPVRPCCGEVHSETMIEYNDELYPVSKLDDLFQDWVQNRELSQIDRAYDNYIDSKLDE